MENIKSIQERYQNGEKLNLLFFWGHRSKYLGVIDKSCLSQWYPSRFIGWEMQFKTAEHYMMANKAKLFKDEEVLPRILEAETPAIAKSLGRHVKRFDPVVWDHYKYEIVVKGNALKFSQNPYLKEFLLATGDKVLVEASPYDKIWGIGMKSDDPLVNNPLKWNGENLLGFALMEVRDMLKR